MGISIRAYGRHRGVSDTAVRKAIKAGRITKEPDGKIDIEKADREWEANTNQSQQRTYTKKAKSIQPVFIEKIETVVQAETKKSEENDSDLPPETVGVDTDETIYAEDIEPSEGMSYAQARTANEILKAQTSELKLQELKGDLVNKAKALDHIFKLARTERDAWVGWPSRVAALMAADLEIDPHKMHITLEQYVREHLSDLANIEPKIN